MEVRFQQHNGQALEKKMYMDIVEVLVLCAASRIHERSIGIRLVTAVLASRWHICQHTLVTTKNYYY